MARTKKLTKTPRQWFIHDFLTDECCGQPMQTGYDVVTHSCHHTNHEAAYDNFYYAMCDACGNEETLCGKCIDDNIAENLEWWTREAATRNGAK